MLTIAHRLETIADYDLIVVMDDGRLGEVGSPYALLVDEMEVCHCEGSDLDPRGPGYPNAPLGGVLGSLTGPDSDTGRPFNAPHALPEDFEYAKKSGVVSELAGIDIPAADAATAAPGIDEAEAVEVSEKEMRVKASVRSVSEKRTGLFRSLVEELGPQRKAAMIEIARAHGAASAASAATETITTASPAVAAAAAVAALA